MPPSIIGCELFNDSVPSCTYGLVIAAVAITLVAGVVRGTTGFGGALVMAPPFALLFGPVLTVSVVLLLESIVAAPMLAQARRQIRWRLIGPILGVACASVSIGVYVLRNIDPQILRRAIAAVVVVFSVVLLMGWRYEGNRRFGTSLA